MLYKAQKKFRCGDRMLNPGDIVDLTGVRNLDSLVSNRFLVEAPANLEAPAAGNQADGEITLKRGPGRPRKSE